MGEPLLELPVVALHFHTHTLSPFQGAKVLWFRGSHFAEETNQPFKAAFTGGDDDAEEEDSLSKFGDFCRLIVRRFPLTRQTRDAKAMSAQKKKIHRTTMKIPRNKNGFGLRFREQTPCLFLSHSAAREDSRIAGEIFNCDRRKQNIFERRFPVDAAESTGGRVFRSVWQRRSPAFPSIFIGMLSDGGETRGGVTVCYEATMTCATIDTWP